MRADLKKDLEKRYGVNFITTGQHLIENPPDIISFSPAFDIGLGGGIPKGSFVILSSLFKYGKTTSALSFAKQAKKAGMDIYYGNVEHRLKPRDIAGMSDFDPSEINIIQSSETKILHAEDHLQIYEDILHNEKNCVLIIDSASQLCSEEEYNAKMGERQRAPGAVLLSQFTKKIGSVLPIHNNIVICIVHLIANTGGGHALLVESGGNKIKYQADVHLRAKTMEYLNFGTNDPYGQKVVWEAQTTAIKAPKGKINSYIRYGIGVDHILELIDLGLQLGLISQAGSWYTFEDEKCQGQEKLYVILNEKPDLRQELKRKIYEMVGLINV